MFILKSEIQFDMAHFLSGYNGKCHNLHGHRYRLIVKIKSETLCQEGQTRGMVEDFGVINAYLREIEELFDHKLVLEDNEEGQRIAQVLETLPSDFAIMLLPYRPTAEEMSRDIFNRLKDKGLEIDEVELFETPNNSCIYRES